MADMSRSDPTIDLLRRAHETLSELVEAAEQFKAAAARASRVSVHLRNVAEDTREAGKDA